MGFLKEYITNIAVTVFFITSIELLIPKNNMKKYIRFTLGLILMAVVINPIVKVLNSGSQIDEFINRSFNYYDSEKFNSDSQNFKKENEENIYNTFKNNFEKAIEDNLGKQFPNKKYSVESKIKYNFENNEVSIDEVEVFVYENNGTEKVERVTINLNDDVGAKEKSDLEYSIKKYLSKELKIEEGYIKVLKTSG